MHGTILLVFAFVFFVIGTFVGAAIDPPRPWYGRFSFISAGLAAWSLAELMARWGKI